MGGAERVDRPWAALVEWVSADQLAVTGRSVASEERAGVAGGSLASEERASVAGRSVASEERAGVAGRFAAPKDHAAQPLSRGERPTQPSARARRALASLTNAIFVVVPPAVAGSITAAFAPVEVAYAVGGGILIATSTLVQPVRRRRLQSRGLRVAGSEKYTLTSERNAFHRAVALADRISETWPALGSLVDTAEAEQMLSDALWEMAGLLSRRQTLTGVLADLSSPEFTPTDDLNAQLRATKEALSDLDIDLARREASLRRAEEAGRDFIREQDMRQAIKSAEVELSATRVLPDAGTRLADQTRAVLTAYQELMN
jgi:hypothetical protein